MKATLHGTIDRPAVAAVGVWDPYRPAYEDLFGALRARGRERRLSSLAILLDPNPFMFLAGADVCPVYDDVRARIDLMLGSVDGVLRLRFARRDVDGGAAEFFEAVSGQVAVAELWLGARQSLGRGAAGCGETIAAMASRYRTDLRILPEPPRSTKAAKWSVQYLLRAGRLAEAIAEVGRPPVWRRPRSGRLHLAWRPGVYVAVPLERAGAAVSAERLRLQLSDDGPGLPSLVWPDPRIRYLAFISGPGDTTPAVAVAPPERRQLAGVA